jgi:tetratricopeptide (TPR) repeat protein
MAGKGTTGKVGASNEPTPEAVGAVVGGGKGPRRFSSRDFWALIGVVLCVLVLIGGATYLITNKSDTNKQPAATPLTLEQQQQKELADAKAAVQNIGPLNTEAQRASAAKKYANLGNAELNVDDAQAAIAAYQTIGPLSADAREGASGLMLAYQALGQYDKAAEQCDQFIGLVKDRLKANPNDASSQHYLAAYGDQCAELRTHIKQ